MSPDSAARHACSPAVHLVVCRATNGPSHRHLVTWVTDCGPLPEEMMGWESSLDKPVASLVKWPYCQVARDWFLRRRQASAADGRM